MAWFWWGEFDKRFCGKWMCSEFDYGRIFLDIKFDDSEKGAEVKFSFKMASFDSPAFYVESSYNSLYFFHNDREWRMEYILKFDENDSEKINCKVIQRKKALERDIVFTRLSEEEEKKYKYTVEPKDTDKIQLLKEYAEYGKNTFDFTYEYKFDERENMLDIIEKNNLDELVRGKSDVDTAITLMNWFCEHYRHGDSGLSSERTPQALMEFADKNEGRTNCRGLSIILAHLIRAYNIKAFHITCLPYEQPVNECHVVVSVYCESLNKWIMLDPTSKLYLKNKDGEIIGIEEFRDIIISDGELYPNEDYSSQHWTMEGYREYMAKNLIRLERGIVERYGCDEKDGFVVLMPEKYIQNEANNFTDENYKKHFISSRESFWRL